LFAEVRCACAANVWQSSKHLSCVAVFVRALPMFRTAAARTDIE
jgi:hypothetical protein